ncbi:MAG: c-type cytochrome [Phycisphaerales bacterium]|nr:c-type cytochrome [Phycisphaerales bacterium]
MSTAHSHSPSVVHGSAPQDLVHGARSRDHLSDHEYDGIREYDNPTPGWWHLIFIGSVFFSIMYIAYYHFSPIAWSIEKAWQAEQNAEVKRLFAGKVLTPDEAGILAVAADEPLMQYAAGTFQTNCAACHAKDGGGINGVNLTDDHYKNIKKIPDFYTVITNGANNGAMPSWRTNFSDNERVLLAAYVMKLRGTTPASAKPPEGEVLPPFPKPTK